LELTRKRMQEAIELHLRAMREDGDPISEPSHIVRCTRSRLTYSVTASPNCSPITPAINFFKSR
jgi:hypothetical protein